MYSLEKDVIFKESNKGRSNAIGQTKEKIKSLLSEPKTTVELVKELKINSSVLRLMLDQIQKKGEIEFLGRQHTGAMPTKIWKLC